MATVKAAEKRFHQLVAAWADLDRECSRTYIAWQAACRMREQAAIEKSNAWGDLEMAKAEAAAITNGTRG